MPELGRLPLLEGASVLMGRNRHQSVQVPSWHPSNYKKPSGAPPSGIEVIGAGVSHTVAPLTPNQDGASQNMETMVHGLVFPDSVWGHSAGNP